MKFLKEHSIFICILLVCAVLRFLPLFEYQFTFDELSGLDRTQFNSFSEVIEKGVKIDAHPALVQLMIYYLTRLFGYVTWIIKLPFLLFGFGAIIYAYAFGLRNFSKQAGLFAALIFSFSLIFVFYAPIARMYISGTFFSIALLFYFSEIFFLKKTKPANYMLLGLFALLSALNQHINALFALSVCASGLFFLTRENYRQYLITCMLVVLAYLPHLPVTLYQLSVPGIGRESGGWLEAPEFSVLFSFLKVVFGTGKTYLLLLALIAVGSLLNKRFALSRQQVYLSVIFILNFLVIYLYSVYRSPVFQYSVMLFSATTIILFACSFLEFKKQGVFHVALLVVFSALVYKTYIKKEYLQQCVKTVYEYQFERTAHYRQVYGENNVYPVFFDADTLMKKIYFSKYNTVFDCKISSDSIISNMERAYYKRSTDPVTGNRIVEQEVSSLRLFSEFIAGLKTDYVVLSSSMPQHQAIVKEHFPFLVENTQTQAINYKLYSKRLADKANGVEDDKQEYYSSVKEKGSFIYPNEKEVKWTDKGFTLNVDSTNEYPFGARAALSNVTQKEGQVILVRAIIKTKKRENLLENCITLTDASTNELYGYNAKAASDFVMTKDSLITIYSEYFNGTNYKHVKYKANLNCYLWNRTKENFELKDFEVRVIDYWPRKWDLWD